LKLVARIQVKIDPTARSSMWEDLSRGRLTEVDYLNGEIVRLADSLGTKAPINQRIIELVRDAELRGQRPAQPQRRRVVASDQRLKCSRNFGEPRRLSSSNSRAAHGRARCDSPSGVRAYSAAHAVPVIIVDYSRGRGVPGNRSSGRARATSSFHRIEGEARKLAPLTERQAALGRRGS
jgi:hypothetical protein